jgi:hypothetical protein
MRKFVLLIALAIVGLCVGLAVVGCGSTPGAAKDKMQGDHTGADKMGGDKMGGDKKDKM